MTTARVLIDATAVPADRGGVGRYVDELIGALDAHGADLVLACQGRDAEHYSQLAPSATVAAAPSRTAARAHRLIWEQSGLPALVRKTGADVVHAPHYTMPLVCDRPVVVTVHDATFFTDPHVHTAGKRRFFTAWTVLSARRASRLIVPSQATADELVQVVGADRSRIDVAPHGVDRSRFGVPDRQECARVAATLGIEPGRYVAFLGTHEPRKNLPALIDGWVQACRGLPDPPVLVLAGGAGWDGTVDAAVAAVPGRLRVLRPGYLPLQDLRGFLGGAQVVAYPSLGEGFGLPVLEAMACGAPVLTTRRLSLPEVGGDAVAYCGVRPVDIAGQLRSLLSDSGRRSQLSAAAVQRAGQFTWQASAQAHLRTYAAVAGR